MMIIKVSFYDEIGGGMECTRGNFPRVRESSPEEGPVFAVVMMAVLMVNVLRLGDDEKKVFLLFLQRLPHAKVGQIRDSFF